MRKEFVGDPTRLKQVLINLITNAVKFTHQGTVTINVSLERELEDKSYVAIDVTDTGIGIPADKLTDIFRKFSQGDSSVTRKYGGTGLGLAISKTLVELMGGTILVKSIEGEGSTFTIKLPLLHATKNQLVQKEQSTIPNTESACPDINAPLILLVEDYKPNVLVAGTLLEKLGYRYQVAQNGREAIHKVSNNRFDMILMDVQMPDMDGYSATKAIRANEKNANAKPIPIIGITAHALSGDKEKCLAAGMNDYISKPFNPDELKNKISALLLKNKAA